jgi:hypothetical protein
VATTVNIADGTNGRITGRITAQPRLHQGASSGLVCNILYLMGRGPMKKPHRE